MRSTITVASTIFSLAMLTPMVWGHHSHANYSEGEWLFLEGTVREIYWMNPHSWIYLDVVDLGGQSRAWATEGASLAELRRDGWTENSIQAGDELTLKCHPLTDGARGCLLGYITLEDNSEKEFD